MDRQWWAWLLLFVLDDLTYYWFHRLSHEVRLLWAGHASHHSSVRFNYATALRAGVGEGLVKPVFWLWLALLGFDPVMILAMIGVNLMYQFWVHTDLVGRLPGWFEAVFSAPSHHRVHHASNRRYLDRNHGGVLIVWDRLFGTFAAERVDDPPRYRLTRPARAQNPLGVAVHEYVSLVRDLARCDCWADRWRCLVRAPAWRCSVLRMRR